MKKIVRKKYGREEIPVPAPMTTPRTTVRILYQAKAGVTPNVTTNDIFKSMFINVNASTANKTLFGSCRLKRVSMWGPSPAAGAQIGIGFSWGGGLVTGWGMTEEHSGISTAQDRPAFVTAKPPKMAGCSQWFNTSVSSSVLFEIVSCPTGSLVQIEFDAVLVDDGLACLLHTSINIGVNNIAYYGYLDFSSNGAASKLEPVGVATLL